MFINTTVTFITNVTINFLAVLVVIIMIMFLMLILLSVLYFTVNSEDNGISFNDAYFKFNLIFTFERFV